MLKLRKNSLTAEQRQIINDVKKMLLPAPSPFVQWLERLIMLMPRRFEAVRLVPGPQIDIVDADCLSYKASAAQPYFEVFAENENQSAGWFFLEMSLVRFGGNRIANLYWDAGRGYCKDDSIFIPSNRRGSIGEVVFLPHGLSKLRWSPMETGGRFNQSPLIVHRISAFESYFRRAWRVGFDLWNFRALSLQERDGIDWFSLLLNLKKAYGWSASLRRANSAVEYPTFIRRNDTLSNMDLNSITHHITRLAKKPLLSIVMPVFNPEMPFFKSAIDSVIAQKYPFWELCIADDGSSKPEVREFIEACNAQDKRVKYISRMENGGISAALNSALSLETGDFIVRMNQHDVIPSHALYHVAVEINRYPNAQLIYSDEDKLNEFGKRLEPHFKSDWNPDLFYSQNMFGGLAVFRTPLVRKVGGFRSKVDGAADYDLVLRCLSNIEQDTIRHIPRVLYHSRLQLKDRMSFEKSVNGEVPAMLVALQDHFVSTGIRAEQTEFKDIYRIRYPVPEKQPLVTLIIPTRDQVDVLKKCIESIKAKTNYRAFEVLVLDNQSQEPAALEYLASIKEDRRFKVIQYDAPFNYSAINNYAVTFAQGEIIGLVNNDVEVISDDWLSEMVSHVVRPEVGAVGAKLLYSNGVVQHAGVILGYGGLAGHAHKFFENDDVGYFGRASATQALSAVTAACLLVRKDVYLQVGGLDEVNLTVAFNDVDFCIKVREAGYRNIYTPYALLHHHESVSRGQENTPEKQARFLSEVTFMQKKWGDIVKVDPYYNPNLILTAENFSLANHAVRSSHHGYPLDV